MRLSILGRTSEPCTSTINFYSLVPGFWSLVPIPWSLSGGGFCQTDDWKGEKGRVAQWVGTGSARQTTEKWPVQFPVVLSGGRGFCQTDDWKGEKGRVAQWSGTGSARQTIGKRLVQFLVVLSGR